MIKRFWWGKYDNGKEYSGQSGANCARQRHAEECGSVTLKPSIWHIAKQGWGLLIGKLTKLHKVLHARYYRTKALWTLSQRPTTLMHGATYYYTSSKEGSLTWTHIKDGKWMTNQTLETQMVTYPKHIKSDLPTKNT